jgi:hypothetical protein
MGRSRNAVDKLIAHETISLNETIAVARTLVRVEEKTNPNSVGGEVRIIKILPTGAASYLIEDLPKTGTAKKKAEANKQKQK